MHNGASQADAQDATQEAFIESWKLMSSDPGRWQAITGKEAWIQSRAQCGRSGNVPAPEKESVPRTAVGEAGAAPGPELSSR